MNEPTTTEVPAAPAVPASPAAPPAATVVVTGSRTEREVQLEQELEQKSKTLKDRELQIMQLEDEKRVLMFPPKPKKPKKAPSTFFDDVEGD